ncbi:hypothetical protein F4777DRAFT_540127 [Nemania sp. FL0916]|nr:hypothetical protein F4777DRAFT_540127 [Nemania sp. FL0916]
MFAVFLSPGMTYSCPIWHPKSDPESATESLENAKKTKLKYIINAAHIKPTYHVLEFGTGWGSFAIKYGCQHNRVSCDHAHAQPGEKRVGGTADRRSWSFG